MRFFILNFKFLLAWVFFVTALEVLADEPNEVSFGLDVRPILSNYCVHCHGPDEEHRKADLQLHTQDGLFSGDIASRIVVPGKPEELSLIHI